VSIIVKAEGPSGPAKIRSDDPKHALGLVQYLRTIGYNAWVEDTRSDDPKHALGLVQYLRTIGYNAWVEDTNGNEIRKGP
jgi:hypothetical protein